MKIAIIGAGISGLTAARNLHAQGMDVTVFDKARGKGGRLTTKQLDMGAINIGAQYFTAKDPRFIKQTQQWVANNIAAKWAFSPHKLHNNKLAPSPDTRKRYVGCNGMRSLCKDLAQHTNIKTQTHIERVITDNHTLTLIDAEQRKHAGFDWVISTLPAEQAKALFDNFENISSQISDEVHLPCCAVTLATKGNVDSTIQGIFGDNDISWVSRLSSQPGWIKPTDATFDDVWELHFSPEWSQKQANRLQKDIIEDAHKWLERITHTHLIIEDSYYHFWRYANLHNKDDQHHPIIDYSQRIAITGAWCFGGRVEGGFLSGENIANTLLTVEPA